jgi:hypothetical protein
MPEAPSANMALVLPTEGADAGEWDQYLNDAFGLVDSHNHTTGQGAKVPTAGLNINADLAMSSSGNFYALTSAKAVDFQPQAAAGMTAYAGALFVNSSDSNNLYFRTQSGTNVRIINGTSLDITVAGGIGGDYTAVAAEAAFSDAGKEYTWKQKDPDNFWAAMRSGPLRIAQLDTTESVYVELIAPAALGGSYTITLPTAAPATFNPVTMTTGGVLSVLTSNENITLSGTGDIKHGDRVITVLPAFSGNKTSTNIGYAAGAAPNYVTPTAGSETWVVPVPLRAGKRIKSITWHYQRAGGTLTFALRKTIIATNVDSSVASSTDNSTSGYTSITTSAINYTILSTEQSYLHWTTGANADRWHYAVITYDHP